jgi:hypothetical protein
VVQSRRELHEQVRPDRVQRRHLNLTHRPRAGRVGRVGGSSPPPRAAFLAALAAVTLWRAARSITESTYCASAAGKLAHTVAIASRPGNNDTPRALAARFARSAVCSGHTR